MISNAALQPHRLDIHRLDIRKLDIHRLDIHRLDIQTFETVVHATDVFRSIVSHMTSKAIQRSLYYLRFTYLSKYDDLQFGSKLNQITFNIESYQIES